MENMSKIALEAFHFYRKRGTNVPSSVSEAFIFALTFTHCSLTIIAFNCLSKTGDINAW